MSKLVISILSVLLCSVSIAAQQQSTITIQKSSELVTIPVLVTDKSGKPIHGLAKQDFTVVEDGKITRPVAVFEEMQGVSAPLRRTSATETVFSNFGSRDDKPRRVTIIVLDLLNTPFAGQALARANLLKFLAGNVRGEDPMALLVIDRNGLKQIHAITTNPEVLVQALKKVTGKHSAGDAIAASEQEQREQRELAQATDDSISLAKEMNQLDAFQRSDKIVNAYEQREAIRTTLAALEQVAQAFSGVPGRKTLIWASSGFPILLEDPQTLSGFDFGTLGDYQRAFRAMNSANIAMYPIDALGIVGRDYSRLDATRRFAAPYPGISARPLYDLDRQRQDTLREFADATGGIACLGTNDLAKCFQKAQEDTDSYYMLAYYLPSEDRKPGWHKLQVKLDQKHVHVRSRNGFLVPDPAVIEKQETRRTEILTALGSPVDYTNLHLMVAWGNPKAETGKQDHKLASFQMAIPPSAVTIDAERNNYIDLDVAIIAARADNNKIAADLSKTIEGHLKPESVEGIRQAGLRFADALSLPEGKFTVRFVVRDNLGGKIGTVTAPLEIN